MDEKRKLAISAALDALVVLPGVAAVRSDDWDSTSVRVFIELTCSKSYDGVVQSFPFPLSTTRARISAVLAKLKITANPSNGPTRILEYVPQAHRLYPERRYNRLGYTCNFFCYELHI